jgi:hypothetical protein
MIRANAEEEEEDGKIMEFGKNLMQRSTTYSADKYNRQPPRSVA